ncbi:kinase-like domain-containing protein [Immersiella caudata]|uniref:Kinase-like domain-containing protein n=1 Tax=Immersiella caudata TaxID=314043 RepID=A0AA39WFN4_9PEZI|nr:kinase-like domain-containing protein [Immersiella caudata]
MSRPISPIDRLVRLSGLDLPDHQSAQLQDRETPSRSPVLHDRDLRDITPQSENAGSPHVKQDPNYLSVQTAPFRREGGVPTGLKPTPQSELSVITDLGRKLRRRTDSSALTCDKNPGALQDALSRASVHSAAQRADFLPSRQLPRLINPDSVEKELAVYQKSVVKRIKTLDFRLPLSKHELALEAHRICGSGEQSWRSHFEAPTGTKTVTKRPDNTSQSYRKILAILILIDRPSRIYDFVEEGICDADLPLEKFSPPGKPSHRWELRRKDSKAALKCFNKKRNWRQSTLRKFEATQWTVLAPYLGQDSRKVALRFKLPDSAILPFTTWKQMSSSGGFSKVFEAEIHPDHHAFNMPPMSSPQLEAKSAKEKESVPKPQRKNLVVAVKQLHSKTTEQEFLREFRILRVISKYQHEHLITLLASYEQNGLYHFVFPLAGANLFNYWKTVNGSPERSPTTAMWVAEQCEGLARGLETVHKHDTFSSDSLMYSSSLGLGGNSPLPDMNGRTKSPRAFHCRHGDIKPENILWFPGPDGDGKGVLKIADFGAAEVTDKDEAPWKKNPASLIYEPPEARIRPLDGFIKTSYDIWCLGCVFMNMSAWYFGGWQGIEDFLTRRQAVGFSLHRIRFHTSEFYFEDKNDKGEPAAKVKPVISEVMCLYPPHL